MGNPKYLHGFNVALHPEVLDLPKRWIHPRMVFVDSMGDLFHEDVPLDFIFSVVRVSEVTPRHTYQLLTKRPERLAEVSKMLRWPPKRCGA
jgi:protein gp37